MEPDAPPPLTERSSKRRARRSSNPDFIPSSVIAACKSGDRAVVAQFLAVRSNLLQLDTHAEDTSTLLHVAAESGTAKVIELLLANGASHRSGGKAVLGAILPRQRASTCGRASTPQTRLREPLGFLSEASVTCLPPPTIRRSCLDDDGQTPLHMATAAGHLDAVKGTLLTAHCSLLTTHYSLLTTYYSLPTTYYLLLDSVKGLTRGECPELTVLDKFRMTSASSVKGRPPLHGQPAPRSLYGPPAPPPLYDTAPHSLSGLSIWRARAGTPRPWSTWCPFARSTGTCVEARRRWHRRRSWRSRPRVTRHCLPELNESHHQKRMARPRLSTLHYPLASTTPSRRRSSWRSSRTTSRWSRSLSDTSPHWQKCRAIRLAPGLATLSLQRLRGSSAHVAAFCFDKSFCGPEFLPIITTRVRRPRTNSRYCRPAVLWFSPPPTSSLRRATRPSASARACAKSKRLSVVSREQC